MDKVSALRRSIEALEYENDHLKNIVWGWYCRAVRPDDVSIYYTEEQLIERSEPYASPALTGSKNDE